MTNFLWLVIIKIALKPSLVSSPACIGETRLIASQMRSSFIHAGQYMGDCLLLAWKEAVDSSQDVI